MRIRAVNGAEAIAQPTRQPVTEYEWIYQRAPALMGGCRGVKLAGFLTQAGFQVRVREYHQQFLFPSEVILAFSDQTMESLSG